MNNNWLTIEQEEKRVILKKCSKEAEGEIVIPEGVDCIGDRAFQGCSGITSIILPKSLEVIGKYAFCNCSRLQSINIPKGLKRIGDNAFKGTKIYYHSVSIPESVELGFSPFEYPDLDKININEAVMDFCLRHDLPKIEKVPDFIRELSEEIPDWKEQIKQTYFWHVFWYRCHRAVPVYTIFQKLLTGKFNELE